MAAGLAALGVILWRRHSAAASWNAELAKSTTELDWVDAELLPALLGAPTSAEFVRTWTDGRSRLVATDQQLFGLSRSAPDENRTQVVSQLRTTIAGLIAAVDAEAGLTSSDPDELRAIRAGVEKARSEFKAALEIAKEGRPQDQTGAGQDGI